MRHKVIPHRFVPIVGLLMLWVFVFLAGCGGPYLLLEYLDGTSPLAPPLDPGGGDLRLVPENPVVSTDDEMQFIASGGTPPYVFDVSAGTAVIDSGTGFFTAGDQGIVTVSVTDLGGAGSTVQTNVEVIGAAAGGPVQISPLAITLNPGEQIQFTAEGGVGTYQFSIYKHEGSIDKDTGVFTALIEEKIKKGVALVAVVDDDSNVAYAAVRVRYPGEGFSLEPPIVVIQRDQPVTIVASGAPGPGPVTWDPGTLLATHDMGNPGTIKSYTPLEAGATIVIATDDGSPDVYLPVVVLEP